MSEAKHTPGPWSVAEAALGKISQPAVVSVGRGICTLPSLRNARGKVSDRAGEIAANACLIAAAPDLLHELEMILSACEGEGWTLWELRTLCAGRARDGIAKAEGEK